MNAREIVKERVKMADVYALYGLEETRSGAIRCPFHTERTASLKTYDNDTRWHCFGCGAGGDVIDFVRMYSNLSFGGALLKLDSAFHLGLELRPMNLRERERARREAAEQARKRAEQKRMKQRYQELCRRADREFGRLFYALKEKAPKAGETPDAEFSEALQRLPYIQYWIEENMTFEAWERGGRVGI